MAKNNNKTYWPHMIVGFLAVGLTLSYWTIKSAMSLPVQESNQYMLKYQTADININQIMERKQAFDSKYTIQINDVETMVMIDNIHSRRAQDDPIKLRKGSNTFTYAILAKDGQAVSDANVTFLLTQPHHRSEDQLITNIAYKNNTYIIHDIEIEKEGRYTLQLRAEVGDTMGYSEISAYLKL